MSINGARDPSLSVLPGAERPHLRALTSLRIFAALHVLLYHFAKPLLRRESIRLHATLTDADLVHRSLAGVVDILFNISRCGAASVSLFFVLSGFILAYNYLDATSPRQTSRGAFWLARFARVYPAYLLAWVIAAPSALTHFRDAGARASHLKWALLPPLSLLASHAWVPPWALEWNSPSWSLCTEAFFYLSFPLVFMSGSAVVFSKRPERRSRRALQFLGWSMLAMLLPLLYRLLNPDHLGPRDILGVGDDYDAGAHWFDVLVYLPLLRQPELWAGVALGRLFLIDLRDGRRLGAWVAPTAALLIVAVFAASSYVPAMVYASGALAPLFGLLIYGLSHGGWLAELISGSVLVLLGEASYALYILHVPLAGWMRMVVKKLHPSMFAGLEGELARTPGWGYLLLYSLLTVAISVLVFRYFETPARYLLRKTLGRDPVSASGKGPPLAMAGKQ